MAILRYFATIMVAIGLAACSQSSGNSARPQTSSSATIDCAVFGTVEVTHPDGKVTTIKKTLVAGDKSVYDHADCIHQEGVQGKDSPMMRNVLAGRENPVRTAKIENRQNRGNFRCYKCANNLAALNLDAWDFMTDPRWNDGFYEGDNVLTVVIDGVDPQKLKRAALLGAGQIFIKPIKGIATGPQQVTFRYTANRVMTLRMNKAAVTVAKPSIKYRSVCSIGNENSDGQVVQYDFDHRMDDGAFTVVLAIKKCPEPSRRGQTAEGVEPEVEPSRLAPDEVTEADVPLG